MKVSRILYIFFTLVLVAGIFGGCQKKEIYFVEKKYRVGIDPKWFPHDFEEKEPYVFGYIEELLFELSKLTHIEFERVRTNWDNLFFGLEFDSKKQSQYDAVISSKKPYLFNIDKYDFSPVILEMGNVLVFPKKKTYFSMKELANKRLAILSQEFSSIEKNPSLILVEYQNIADIMIDLLDEQVEAALIPLIPAVGYLTNLYPNTFVITFPLEEEGLRFATKKGEKKDLQLRIEKGLKHLKESGKLLEIQQKWKLYNDSLIVKKEKK